ncbi:MAG: hypothetical protein H6553_09950 [Chitinophagales bacterium]|nr:hypothetical protein [Chitinophagales bacterium]
MNKKGKITVEDNNFYDIMFKIDNKSYTISCISDGFDLVYNIDAADFYNTVHLKTMSLQNITLFNEFILLNKYLSLKDNIETKAIEVKIHKLRQEYVNENRKDILTTIYGFYSLSDSLAYYWLGRSISFKSNDFNTKYYTSKSLLNNDNLYKFPLFYAAIRQMVKNTSFKPVNLYNTLDTILSQNKVNEYIVDQLLDESDRVEISSILKKLKLKYCNTNTVSESLLKLKAYQNNVLQLYDIAPNFSVRDTNFNSISLYDVCSKNDFTLLLFWKSTGNDYWKVINLLKGQLKEVLDNYNVKVFLVNLDENRETFINTSRVINEKEWILSNDRLFDVTIENQYLLQEAKPWIFVLNKNAQIIATRFFNFDLIEESILYYLNHSEQISKWK